DAQRLGCIVDRDQAIDVRVLAWVRKCILAMFSVELDALLCSLGGDRAVDLRKMVIDRQRPGLTRFVLDLRDFFTRGVEELDRSEMGNLRQLLERIGKAHR